MSRWIPPVALALAVAAILSIARPARLAADAPPPEPFYAGRFSMTVTPAGTILLDTTCGATYRLLDVTGKGLVWERLPFNDKGISAPYPPSTSLNHYANLREFVGQVYQDEEKKMHPAQP